jgi:hypothetical protein
MNLKKIALFILIGFGIITKGLAQDSTHHFTVDRPGIADLPYIIHPGQFQFEAGLDYFNRGDLRRLQMPAFQFRTGLSDRAEIRLGVRYVAQDSLQDVVSPFGWSQGSTPFTIGIKVPFVKENGLIPEIAILTDIILPFTGNKPYRPNFAGHDIFLLCNNNFNHKWSLNYNGGVIWEGNSAGAVWTYSVCLSHSFSHRLGVFIEHYAFIPDEGYTEWGGDAGITYLIAPKMQLDISSGLTKVVNQNLYFVGCGFSFRVDAKKKKRVTRVENRD